MGRYYTGDIEGEFAFSVQSSNDADFFGSIGQEPNHLYYYFDKGDLPSIKKGLKECKKKLGKHTKVLEDCFADSSIYNDETVGKICEVSQEEARTLQEWCFRLYLGKKILTCVEYQDYCEFEAEL
jgi:hypothetical protein